MESASKRKGLHAHFDCFGGATAGAMLAACLHADSGGMLAENIESSIQKEFRDFNLKCLHVSNSETASMAGSVATIILEEGSAAALTVQEIVHMLGTAAYRNIPDFVCKQAKEVFQELAIAESVVHGRSSIDEQVEFSVASVANVVEVVATLLALNKLGVESVSCGPLPLGEGSIWSEDKGLLPIPSPTTLQLLLGMPTCPGPRMITEDDWITPTAAALLRILTNVSSTHGPTQKPTCFTTRTIGVGVSREGSESRVLRLLLGEASAGAEEESLQVPRTAAGEAVDPSTQNDGTRWKMDQLTQLEANLDDMTAEALAFAVQLLLNNGAVDAWVVPIVMKKGRAAHTLYCLCHSNDSIVNKLLELVFRHTTTLGVRICRNIDRAALRRSFLTAQTPFHESSINVKVGFLGNEAVSMKAEFEDCARISRETNVPIKQVADCATQQAQILLQKSGESEDCTNNS